MGTLGHLLLIAVAYAIVNNVVLSQFLGICPFLGVSKNTKTAAGTILYCIRLICHIYRLSCSFL